jgi:hypothetical protein
LNAAALMRYFVRENEKKLTHFVTPAAGGLICFTLGLNLSQPAKIAGAIWMTVGKHLARGRPAVSAET